ncbi:MAG: flagellar biosynthesis anti-sigma factor FlgM [Casimicrobiaceae bacterium]
MKINPSVTGLDQGNRTAATTGDRPAQAPQAGAKGPTAKGDTIHLSALSSQLQALDASAQGAEFDRAKVEAIKDAIREGRLTVNPDVVADKMLAAALAMMKKDG